MLQSNHVACMTCRVESLAAFRVQACGTRTIALNAEPARGINLAFMMLLGATST